MLYLLRFRINLLIEAFPKNPLSDFAFLFSDEVSKNAQNKKSRRSNGYLVGKKQFKIFESTLFAKQIVLDFGFAKKIPKRRNGFAVYSPSFASQNLKLLYRKLSLAVEGINRIVLHFWNNYVILKKMARNRYFVTDKEPNFWQ